MNYRSPLRIALMASVFLTYLIIPSPASAHEKWFTNASDHPTNWDFFFSTPSLLAVGGVIVLAVVWRLVFTRFFPTPELPFLDWLGGLSPWIPRLLAMHIGVSLLALGLRGAFLAPYLSVHDMPGGDALAFAEGVLGIWFISGVGLRGASIFLVVSGPFALMIEGPVSLLEAVPLLGISCFLIVLPPSANRWGATEVDPELIRRAVQMLRIGVGVGLVVLAFSEKFANPSLAREILEENPDLNVFTWIGMDLSHETFIRISAATELFFGLLVLSGAGAQLVTLVAAVPFNLTLLLFGVTEMIGHLPVYGSLLALLVYGSNRVTAQAVRSWRVGPLEGGIPVVGSTTAPST